jgi:hypothetical protein
MSASKPTQAAMRAATSIAETIAGHFGEAPPSSMVEFIAAIVDRETGLPNLVDVVEEMLAEAGDLIESRNSELVAQARAALLHSADAAPRED